MEKDKLSFFSFSKDQDYYTTTIRKVVDFIIGFVAGWMFLGFIIWWTPQLFKIFALITLVIAGATLYFGRKWLGIAVAIGAVGTYIFAGIVTGIWVF